MTTAKPTKRSTPAKPARPTTQDRIRELVDAAPPLTDEQTEKLRTLLALEPGHDASAAATAALVVPADSSPAGKLVGGRRGAA